MGDRTESTEKIPQTGIFFTPKVQLYLDNVTKFSSHLNAVPYRFKESENKLKSSRWWSQWMWYLNMAVGLSYPFFVVYRCVQVNMNDSRSDNEKLYMKILAMYWSISFVFNLTTIINRTTVPAFMNSYIEFTKTFERMYVRKNAKPSTLMAAMGWYLQYVYFACICNIMLTSVNGFLNPFSPEIPTIFHTDKQHNIKSALTSAALMGYLGYVYISNGMTIIMLCFSPTAGIVCMIHELSQVRCKSTIAELRTSLKKFQMYRCLQVQGLLYNEVYGRFFLPGFQLAGILMVVYCSYAGIRMPGSGAPLLALVGGGSFVAVLVAYSFLAEYHFRSEKLLGEWRQQLAWDVGQDYAQRYVMSLRPLKAEIKGFYFVDRPMVLTMASIMISNTANILMVET